MLLSIITPTNSPKYLDDAYHSLQRQTHQEWEWVLVPNGDAVLSAEIRQDPKVRIIEGHGKETRIGALKRVACDAARGQAFIELDHDDLLVPGETLGLVAQKVQEGASFVYSDTALVKGDLRSHSYSADYGWESYEIEVYGHKLAAQRNFPVTARSLAEIYYAPDHLRCWSRQAYYQAGGHDPSLAVGDDHDLMCRTYLAGGQFAHTGGCHYLYRLHPDNTVNKRNKEIQRQVAVNRNRYTGQLIREWVRREQHGTILLDEQIVGADGYPCWDWNTTYSTLLSQSTAGLLVCDDRLQYCPGEHVANFFNAAYDHLLPGGWLEVTVPTTQGNAAVMDPLAQTRFNYATFLYYTHKERLRDRRLHARFQLVGYWQGPRDAFEREHGLLYLTVWLCALKNQRQPGLQHI
jgi:glycosyltransferase involved in cell wall biosynthesis